MKVRIQCFGIASEICAKDFLAAADGPADCIEMILREGSSVADLHAALQEEYPALGELRHFFIARNQRQAAPDELIAETDELVIIPPVAGG